MRLPGLRCGSEWSTGNVGRELSKSLPHQLIHLRYEALQVDGGELAVFHDEFAVDEDEFGTGGMAEEEGAERVLGGGAGEFDGVEVVDRDIGGVAGGDVAEFLFAIQ